MEKRIINTLMELNGYNEYICEIFPHWEYVKDEMLLPERKAGSGNGTVHIYLQQNNLASLEKCFPRYFSNKKRGQNIGDDDCPVIEHFCFVPNLLCLASTTYQNYGYNDHVFNLLEYLKEVLAMEQNGFIRFESIFKLSTDNRPYFKQFNKKVFTKIIRTLFIGGKSAYRISLYRNSSSGDVATFWQLGQTLQSEYLITLENNNTSINSPAHADEIITPKPEVCVEDSSLETHPFEQPFRDYLRNKGRKATTIDNYVTVLNVILPRLIRENLDSTCRSLFDTAEYKYLLDLENKLWKCPAIHDYDERGHRQLSAGFHRYLEFAQSRLTDEELAIILFPK